MNPLLSAQSSSVHTVLRFVHGEMHTPIVKQELWVFCYEAADALHLLSQQWVLTDGEGQVELAATNPCPWVAALLPVHTQPSGKPSHGPAYWVFAASWPTGSGVPTFPDDCPATLCPASAEIAVRSEWPLILFNVVASLEWQPTADDGYVAQLYQGLQSASAYLADLTDGYMAFGPVTIQSAGRNWEGADMRFQVANDQRPAAFVGGIVPRTITYTSTVSSTITLPTITLRPAASFFGRYWTRSGDASVGEWDQPDGFRTLAHEWAHYALFLYDEYADESGALVQCVPADLRSDPSTGPDDAVASAMSWQYQSSELWHPADFKELPPLHPCYATDQYRVHGESDWATTAQWFNIQQLALASLPIPPAAPEPTLSLTEGVVLANLFNHSPTERTHLFLPIIAETNAETRVYGNKTMSVYTADTPAAMPSQVTGVYLLATGATAPTQILYQGTPVGHAGAPAYIGDMTLLGVDPDADARILVDRYAYSTPGGVTIAGGRFLYPHPGTVAALGATTVVATPNSSDLSLDLIYGMSADPLGGPAQLTRITAVVDDPGKTSLVKPYVQLCTPDAEIGCPDAWHQRMTPTTDGSWYADFAPLPTMAEFPLYGVVRVVDDLTQQDSLLRWFRDVGGISPSPGHKTGAPASDGADERVSLRALNNEVVEGSCNRVLIMPAAQYAALFVASPPGFRLIGTPLDIDLLLGKPGVDKRGLPLCTSSQAETQLRLSMAYDQKAIDRLGVDEAELRIFRYEPGNGWIDPSPPLLRLLNNVTQMGNMDTFGPRDPQGSIPLWDPIETAMAHTKSVAQMTTSDPALNIVSTIIAAQSGIYAIGWQP